MKLKAVLFLALCTANVTFAQKSKVLSAYNLQQAYYQSLDCEELGKARDAIEMALTHEVSATWAKTWFYRGNIYYDITTSQSEFCKRLADNSLDLAYESYNKALEYDEKDKYKKQVEPKLSNVGKLYTMRGINNFNVKKYEEALSDFETSIKINDYFGGIDTVALYNASLVCEKLKYYDRATLYYEGLIDIGYKAGNNVSIYHQLAMAYYNTGDSTKAFQAIKAGRIKEPTNQDLIIDELNFYLTNNEDAKALENLDIAIKEMPGVAQLHFAKGTILDKMGELDKAAAEYNKSIEIDPEHKDSYFNLGAMYFNKGVEYVNNAADLDENQAAEFKAAEASAEEYFQKALPYLEKANEIDPYDQATLSSLKNLYSRMGNEEGYKRVSDILDN